MTGHNASNQRCLTTDDTPLDWEEVGYMACHNYAFTAKSNHQGSIVAAASYQDTVQMVCDCRVHTPEANAKLDVGAVV